MKAAAPVLLCLLVWLGPRGARAEDWPQLQHDPAHTGYTPDQPAAPYRLLWSRDLGEPMATAAQVIVADGKVFAATNYGRLYASHAMATRPSMVG